LPIGELAQLIAEIVGFTGEIAHDRSKPDGTPRKLMSGARMRAMGWSPKMGLRQGLAETYAWYLAHHAVTAPS
jgi:GDP-L-fucose synthase